MFFESDYTVFSEAGVAELEVIQQNPGGEGPYAEYCVARLNFDRKGHLLEEVQYDENGWELLKIKQLFSKKGLLVRREESEGEEDALVTENHYNKEGFLLTSKVRKEPERVYRYNAERQLVSIESEHKKGVQAFLQKFHYDSAGRKVREVIRENGKQFQAIDLSYDEEGRKLTEILFDGRNRKFLEDRFQFQPKKTWKRYWYGEDGTKTIVTYRYNDADQIVSAESREGQGTLLEKATYAYNDKGLRQEQEQTFLEGGKEAGQYKLIFNYRFHEA